MSIGYAAKSSRAALKKSGLGSFLSSPYALRLTVPHKTVAEAR
jgi:hypothetical protein